MLSEFAAPACELITVEFLSAQQGPKLAVLTVIGLCQDVQLILSREGPTTSFLQRRLWCDLRVGEVL